MSAAPIRAESGGGQVLAFLDATTARLLADALEFGYAERFLDPSGWPTFFHDVAELRRAAAAADQQNGRPSARVVHITTELPATGPLGEEGTGAGTAPGGDRCPLPKANTGRSPVTPPGDLLNYRPEPANRPYLSDRYLAIVLQIWKAKLI